MKLTSPNSSIGLMCDQTSEEGDNSLVYNEGLREKKVNKDDNLYERAKDKSDKLLQGSGFRR